MKLFKYKQHQQYLQEMNNEIKDRKKSKVVQKISLMLATIISLQQQIQSIRCKLCGYSNFSPQFYYKQIDKHEKGYIDLEDFTTFIKKSKPLFNIDHRYLQSLFAKFNQNESTPHNDKLTYFGYLNIIKPYFDATLARDLLLRDSISMGTQLNFSVKKLFEDLFSSVYVCIAQHQRLKQAIMFGDLDEGGVDQGFFANIYQFYDIILRFGDNIQSNYPTIRNVVSSGAIISQTSLDNIQMRSDRSLKSLEYLPSKSTINNISNNLRVFYNFMSLNSEYQLDQNNMKYLLSHLLCPQYLMTNQKYLTTLFMPVTGSINLQNAPAMVEKQRLEIRDQKEGTSFLKFVHPNSVSKQELQRKKIGQNVDINRKIDKGKEKSSRNKMLSGQRGNRVVQDRALFSGNESSIKTPILQKFMRESKVLKNMSRYNNYNNKQKTINQQEEESAFINESKYQDDFVIAKQHRQSSIKKDIYLQQVLNNSQIDRSQNYDLNAQKSKSNHYQITQRQERSFKGNSYIQDEDYQILNDFIRR